MLDDDGMDVGGPANVSREISIPIEAKSGLAPSIIGDWPAWVAQGGGADMEDSVNVTGA